jgi:MFS family permease
VSRFGALPTLLVGAAFGVAGFVLLALWRAEAWQVIVAGLLTQVSVTVAYATLPALVVQAVEEPETGVANAVNSIARAVGQALGSTLAVTLLAAHLDEATGFPDAVAITWIAVLGAVTSAAVVLVAALGMRVAPARRDDPLRDVEEATARAGEWSPVSGIR